MEEPWALKSRYESNFTNLDPLICRTNLIGQSTKLEAMMFILSAVWHTDLRKAIRETWGKVLKEKFPRVKFSFILGQTNIKELAESVAQESYNFFDIVQTTTLDTRYNLPLKHVALLDIASTHCADVPLILRADDDLYIRVPQLVEILSNITEKNTTNRHVP